LKDVNYKLDDLIVQWHSHADMGVMWSGTDEANIKDILGLYNTIISVVVNIYGEYRARMDTVVAGHGNFQFDIGKITKFNVALTPYINSPKIVGDVKKMLFQPKPPKVEKVGFHKWDGNNKWDKKWDKGRFDTLTPDKPLIPEKDPNQLSIINQLGYGDDANADLKFLNYQEDTLILRQEILSELLLDNTKLLDGFHLHAYHIHPFQYSNSYVAFSSQQGNFYEYISGNFVKNSKEILSMMKLLEDLGFSTETSAKFIGEVSKKIKAESPTDSKK
jgi:hypothetical protein